MKKQKTTNQTLFNNLIFKVIQTNLRKTYGYFHKF